MSANFHSLEDRKMSWIEKSSLHGIGDLYESFTTKKRHLAVIWSIILAASLVAFVTQTIMLFYNFAHEEHWLSSIEYEVVRELSK